jgi:hypothetical protein
MIFDKTIYILNTNNDGVLNVFTNKKRAIRVAAEYCGEGYTQQGDSFYGKREGNDIHEYIHAKWDPTGEYITPPNDVEITSVCLGTGTGE